MTSTLFNFFNLFPTPEPASDHRPIEIHQSNNDIEFEAQIFDVVNQHRTSLKLPPLKLVTEISDIARKHSQWMCAAGVWEGESCHRDFDSRAKKVKNLRFIEISENVATAEVCEYRYQTIENRRSTANIILVHWLASIKGHREAIEELASTHTGIGVISCEVYDEDGTRGFRIYVTQLFAR